jgi:hypothetical protein
MGQYFNNGAVSSAEISTTGASASWTSGGEIIGASLGPRSPTVVVNPSFEVAMGPSVARLTSSGSPSPFLVAAGSFPDDAISMAGPASAFGASDPSNASARSHRLFFSARVAAQPAARGPRGWSAASPSSSSFSDRQPFLHAPRPLTSSAGAVSLDRSAEQAASLRSAVRLLESFSLRQQVRYSASGLSLELQMKNTF